MENDPSLNGNQDFSSKDQQKNNDLNDELEPENSIGFQLDEEEDDIELTELVEAAVESVNLIRSNLTNSRSRLTSLEIAAFIIPILAFYLLYVKTNEIRI